MFKEMDKYVEEKIKRVIMTAVELAVIKRDKGYSMEEIKSDIARTLEVK